MEKKNWYAIFTVARAEKRVKRSLEQEGIENYLPVREIDFKRNGQERILEIPIVSGCIFVRISEINAESLLSIPGVVTFVQKEQKPMPIPDEQMESLQKLKERCEYASCELQFEKWLRGDDK